MPGETSQDSVQPMTVDSMRLEVSREICRRYALQWFGKMGWHLDRMSPQQASAILDVRALALAARDEVFVQSTIEKRKTTLQDWIFSLSQGFQGQAHSDCVDAIAQSVTLHRVPRAFLYDMLSALESNLYREQLETLEDLRRFCYRQTSSFTMSVGQILGAGEADHRPYFIKLGVGTGILESLLSWHHWKSCNWAPIPEIWLKEAGISANQMLQADTANAQFQSVIRRLAVQGIEELAEVGTMPPSIEHPIDVNLNQWTECSIDKLQAFHEDPSAVLK